MQRLWIRLAIHLLGAGGTLFVTGVGFFLISGLLGLVALCSMVCLAGVIGLAVVDIVTASSAQVTVVGHHWEREVWPQVAELDAKGKIVWDTERSVKLEGDNLSPIWPTVPDDHCSFIGCRRPGTSRESYSLLLKKADGTPATCIVQEDLWPQFALGAALSVQVGGVTGAITCTSAKPAPAPTPTPTPAPTPRRRRNR